MATPKAEQKTPVASAAVPLAHKQIRDIQPGPGFQHQAAKTLDIAVEGESKPIDCHAEPPHLERRPLGVRQSRQPDGG